MKRLAVVAVGALLLAGCSHDSTDNDSPYGPVPVSDWDGGFRNFALMSGELELRDGCLVIVNPEFPDKPGVALFPSMYTSWDPGTEVLTYGGDEYQMGDAIAAGGGGGGELPDHGIPSACLPIIDKANGFFYIEDETIAPNA
jgi:hypothetical protein